MIRLRIGLSSSHAVTIDQLTELRDLLRQAKRFPLLTEGSLCILLSVTEESP